MSLVVTSRLSLLETPIDFVATGDNIVVPALAGASVRVYHLFLVVSADTTITIKHASTAFTGAMSMLAHGSICLDFVGQPWFTAEDNEAFVISQSGTAQVSGQVGYTQIPTDA